ncbi:MAG: ferredoxin [Candidatus Omnitrophota bacterium]
MDIKKVWIEEGCINCGLCVDACAEVFELTDETAKVKSGADLSKNEMLIKKATSDCPVNVIKFE